MIEVYTQLGPGDEFRSGALATKIWELGKQH